MVRPIKQRDGRGYERIERELDRDAKAILLDTRIPFGMRQRLAYLLDTASEEIRIARILIEVRSIIEQSESQ